MKTSITVTIRKVSSGYKVTAFAGESQDHLFSICKVLMKSAEYARCYCVALDWQGEQLFEVRPEQESPAPYQAPVAQYHQHHHPQQHPQMNQYGYHPTPQLPPPPQQQAYYPPPAQQQHFAPPRHYAQYAEAPQYQQQPPQYVQAVPTYEGVIEQDGSYGARPALPGRR